MIALAKMTPERMNTIRDALLRIAISFLRRHCPQKPAQRETDVRYIAAKKFYAVNITRNDLSKNNGNFFFFSEQYKGMANISDVERYTVGNRKPLEQVELHYG